MARAGRLGVWERGIWDLPARGTQWCSAPELRGIVVVILVVIVVGRLSATVPADNDYDEDDDNDLPLLRRI